MSSPPPRITTRSCSSKNNNNSDNVDVLLPRGDDDGQSDKPTKAVAVASRNNGSGSKDRKNNNEQQHGIHDDSLPSSTDGGNEPSRSSARLEKRGTVEYVTNNNDDDDDDDDESDEEDDESDFEDGGSHAADGSNNKKKKNESDTEAKEEGGEDDYSSQTVANLRQLCKNRGLKLGGKKQDLIDRLIDNDNEEEDEEPNRATTRGRAANGTNNKKKNEKKGTKQNKRFRMTMDQEIERLLYLHEKGMQQRENDTKENWDEIYLHLHELERKELFEGTLPSLANNLYRTWFYRSSRSDWDDTSPAKSRGNGPIKPRPPFDIGQFNPSGKMTLDEARKEVEAFALYMKVETGVKKAVLPFRPSGKYTKKFFEEGGQLADAAKMITSMKDCMRLSKSTAIYEKALAFLEEAGLVLKNAEEIDEYYQKLRGNILMGKFRQSSNLGSKFSLYWVNLFNYCEIELFDDMKLAVVNSIVKLVLDDVRANEIFDLVRVLGGDQGDFFNNKIIPLLSMIDEYITEHHSNPDYARIRGVLTKKKPCTRCDDLGRPVGDWHRLPSLTDGQHDGTRESDGKTSQWIKANEDDGKHPSRTSGERLEELVTGNLLVSRCVTHHRIDDLTRTERLINGEDVESSYTNNPKMLLMVKIFLEVKKQLTGGGKCAWTKEKFDYQSCLDGHHAIHQSEDESGGGYKPLRIIYKGKERVFHLAKTKTVKEGLWGAVQKCKTIDELVHLLTSELPLIIFIEACAHRAHHFLVGPNKIGGLAEHLSSQGHDIMSEYFITEDRDSFVIDAEEHPQYRRFFESEEQLLAEVVDAEETSNDGANNADNMDVDDDEDEDILNSAEDETMAEEAAAEEEEEEQQMDVLPSADANMNDDDMNMGDVMAVDEDRERLETTNRELSAANTKLLCKVAELEAAVASGQAIIAANEEVETMLLARINERDATIAANEAEEKKLLAIIDERDATIARISEEEETKLLATINDLSSLTKQMEKLTFESKEKDEKIATMQTVVAELTEAHGVEKETMMRELSTKDEEISDLREECADRVAALEADHAVAILAKNEEIAALETAHAREIATKDEVMAAMEAAHAVAILTKNEEMAALEADHAVAILAKDEEMSDLREECANRVAALEADHAVAILAKDEEMSDLREECANRVAALEADHSRNLENACNYYLQKNNNMKRRIDELVEENDDCIIDYEEEVECLHEMLECRDVELQATKAELQDTKAELSEYESSTFIQVVSGIVRKRRRVSVNNDND